MLVRFAGHVCGARSQNSNCLDCAFNTNLKDPHYLSTGTQCSPTLPHPIFLVIESCDEFKKLSGGDAFAIQLRITTMRKNTPAQHLGFW
jgi:hypothetical protein